MNATALLLLAATAVAGPTLQHRRVPCWVAPAAVAVLAASAAVFAAAGSAVTGFGIGATVSITVAAAALGGLPAAPAAFRIAGRRNLPIVERAEGPLRGGRIIGVFERAAIAVTILSGWPEGIVVVLGVKGLARYPELREPETHASEQFIIGTFASVLWALAVAGIGRGMLS